jgi:hypothetical protein
MDFYAFVWHLLAWSITVALLWPVMFPWLRVAYKIWNGRAPVEEELAEELWVRCAYASFFTTVAAVGLLFLDYLFIEFTDFPPGVIHNVLYFGLLALIAGIMYYCFFMEDFFQGLMLAVIYLYIPNVLLFLMWLVVSRYWPFSHGLFSYVQSWLRDPAGIVSS